MAGDGERGGTLSVAGGHAQPRLIAGADELDARRLGRYGTLGRRTVGPVARLVPDIHTVPDRGLRLTVTGSAFVAPGHPSVEATVRANGVEVGRWRFALGAREGSRSVYIPRAVLERRMPPEISFEIHDPISPLELRHLHG